MCRSALLSLGWTAAPFLLNLDHLGAVEFFIEVTIAAEFGNSSFVGDFDGHPPRKPQPKECGFLMVAKIGEGGHQASATAATKPVTRP